MATGALISNLLLFHIYRITWRTRASFKFSYA